MRYALPAFSAVGEGSGGTLSLLPFVLSGAVGSVPLTPASLLPSGQPLTLYQSHKKLPAPLPILRVIESSESTTADYGAQRSTALIASAAAAAAPAPVPAPATTSQPPGMGLKTYSPHPGAGAGQGAQPTCVFK